MKIAICGSHGVGKTTLMNRIAESHKDWFFVEEQARKCPYPLNREASYQTQRWILENQILRELECYALDTKAVIVCDRSTIDQQAYIWWLFQHGRISKEEYDLLMKTAGAWAETYDLICFLPVEFGCKADEMRDGAWQYQADIDFTVRGIIWKLQSPIELKGDIEKRFRKFERAYNKKVRGEI
jgi:nicotinamide riboside kinase